MRDVEHKVLLLINEEEKNGHGCWENISMSSAQGNYRAHDGTFQFKALVTCLRSVDEISLSVMDPHWQLTWDPNLLDVKTTAKSGCIETRTYMYSISSDKEPIEFILGYSCRRRGNNGFLMCWVSQSDQKDNKLVIQASGLLFEPTESGCQCKIMLQLKGSLTNSEMALLGIQFVDALLKSACHPNSKQGIARKPC
jgi:hypothetical protein